MNLTITLFVLLLSRPVLTYVQKLRARRAVAA
jgi:hypothetical protein